jgi:predicted RNA-binding protein with PUA-like domain
VSYWLLKSEPGDFGVDDLAASPACTTAWDGVRNYQARNFIRDGMKTGDRAFFYHSSCPEPGIVGIVEITRDAYPDETAFDPSDKHFDPKSDRDDPRWFVVDVRLQRKFDRTLPLQKLKQHAGDSLSDFQLLKRGNRLSVMPVSNNEWRFILSLEEKSNSKESA